MAILIDVLVFVVVVVYGLDGYRQGFLRMLVDLGGMILSFVIAIKYYELVAVYFIDGGVALTLSRSLGFFTLWATSQLIIYLLTIAVFRFVPDFITFSKLNKYAGILPGLLKGTFIISLFLILLLTLPLKTATKDNISKSLVGGYLVRNSVQISARLDQVLGTSNKAITFLGRVSQNGSEEKLGFQTTDVKIDEASEVEMLVLLNEKRTKAGLPVLKQDALLRNVARSHGRDMLIKGYISHNDLSGQTPSQRVLNSGAVASIVGENIALAPTVDLAEAGLMNSVKHRENILSDDFNKVGIGVIDAGPFGKMFVEDFSD